MYSRPQPETRPRPLWGFLVVGIVLIALGSALSIAHHQYQARQLTLASSEALFGHIVQRVQHSVNGTYRGPAQALNLLAHDPVADAHTLEQRLAYLGKLAQILNDLPHLGTVFVSWPNGDFMSLRPLLDSELRERFEAPGQAAWLLAHIVSSGDQRESEHRFYDRSLGLVEVRHQADGGFDPRQREWYLLARNSQSHIITSPHVFPATGEFGTTIARESAEGVVLGADITLDRLSASLAGHGVPASSELLLYDEEGTVVAYHDALRIRSTAHGSALRLRTFHELGSTMLARLAEDGYRIERQVSLTLEGQRWLVLQRRLTVPNLPDTFLAVLVPEAELFQAVQGQRRRSLLMEIASALILIALFCLSARLYFRRGL
jgi:hypothetical protein